MKLSNNIKYCLAIIFTLSIFAQKPEIAGTNNYLNNSINSADSVKASNKITVYPEESNEYLLNPGKGWVIYAPFSQYTSETWSKASTGYYRFSWNQIETSDNVYNWEPIDNYINTCANNGVKFSFGVMYANSKYQASPLWLFDLGAEYTLFDTTDTKIPVWSDSIFLKKSEEFIADLTERYNGNPNIAYIDARNYGNWGEWGAVYITMPPSVDPGDSIKKLLLDQYSGFDKTPIILPIPGATQTHGGAGMYPGGVGFYARDQYGFGYRDDSFDYSPRWGSCASALNIAPTVAEFIASYKSLKEGTNLWHMVWYDGMVSSESISGSAFSWLPMGAWGEANTFLEEKSYLVDEWQNKMGYWFKLAKVEYPDNLGNGSTETITFNVLNDGVAPIYVNWNQRKTPVTYVRLALLDSSNNILSRTDALPGINPFNWKPGQTITNTSSFSFPAKSGAAKLAIGVFSSDTLENPDIKFANVGRLFNGWLVFSDSNNTTEVSETHSKENGFYLSQNYPNPFNPSTTIKYTIPESPLSGGVRGGFVTLKIFDILGREVATLVNEHKPAGVYTVEWNGTNSAGQLVGSGIYFYQLKTSNGFMETKKMILLY